MSDRSPLVSFLTAVFALMTGLASAQVPTFEVVPSWPALPNDWVLGQVASVATGNANHVWILHRPRTVPDDEQSSAAPPVLEFDESGDFVRAWGGPSDDYEWPSNEHGIHVDGNGNVWVGGNSGAPEADDMLLKFDAEGELLLQVGRRGQSTGNADTLNLNRPAESFVRSATNEVYVADGYGNRRVIVLDAETGEFKRLWGAFGSEPLDSPPEEGATAPNGWQGSPQFGIVHGIEVSNDGFVYVADRNNSRVQVFTNDGAYRTQAFVNENAASALTVAGIAFSPDAEQRLLYIADQGNALIHIVDRETLTVLDSFGSEGEQPGQFRALHHIATDGHGNIYTAEAQRGRRAQKFALTERTPAP